MADAPSAAVLLFVGARSAPGEWLHVQQLCFERQIAFCALPLMGHGGHPLHGPGNFLAWPDELTFDAVVDDALRAALGLIQELQRRYGEMPIVLAGHSFGARVMSAVWRQLKDSFPLPFAWLINPALHHRQLRGNAEFAKYQRLATTLQHVLGRSEWFWQNLYTLWHPATVLGGEAQSRGRFRAYLRLHAGFYSALYEGLHDDGVQMPPDALVSVSVDDPQLDLRETLLLCARTPSVTVVPLSGGKHNPQAEENGVATNLVATVVERLALERRLQAPRNRRT
jgi:pimeloyl-ACP methyl ester carboxylesterase